jgi:hypothetical protein
MKKLIIVLIMIVMMVPVMGICEEKKEYDPNAVYLGDDPTPHARWVREKNGYSIVYSLENLLKRDEMERQKILDEIQKQRMMDAQDKQERIKL